MMQTSIPESKNRGQRIAPVLSDRMMYFVEVDYGHRIGRAFVERDTADMDRKTTIRDIADGQFRGEVISVLECNPVERLCNDVTEEILIAARVIFAKEIA